MVVRVKFVRGRPDAFFPMRYGLARVAIKHYRAWNRCTRWFSAVRCLRDFSQLDLEQIWGTLQSPDVNPTDFGDALVHVSTKVAPGPRVRWLVDRIASHVNEYSAHDIQKVMLACWDLELDLDFWKVLCGRAQQVIDEFTTEEMVAILSMSSHGYRNPSFVSLLLNRVRCSNLCHISVCLGAMVRNGLRTSPAVEQLRTLQLSGVTQTEFEEIPRILKSLAKLRNIVLRDTVLGKKVPGDAVLVEDRQLVDSLCQAPGSCATFTPEQIKDSIKSLTQLGANNNSLIDRLREATRQKIDSFHPADFGVLILEFSRCQPFDISLIEFLCQHVQGNLEKLDTNAIGPIRKALKELADSKLYVNEGLVALLQARFDDKLISDVREGVAGISHSLALTVMARQGITDFDLARSLCEKQAESLQPSQSHISSTLEALAVLNFADARLVPALLTRLEPATALSENVQSWLKQHNFNVPAISTDRPSREKLQAGKQGNATVSAAHEQNQNQSQQESKVEKNVSRTNKGEKRVKVSPIASKDSNAPSLKPSSPTPTVNPAPSPTKSTPAKPKLDQSGPVEQPQSIPDIYALSPATAHSFPVVTPSVVKPPVIKAPAVKAPVTKPPAVKAPVVNAPVVKPPVRPPAVKAPVVNPPVVKPPVVKPPVVKPTAPAVHLSPASAGTKAAPGAVTSPDRSEEVDIYAQVAQSQPEKHTHEAGQDGEQPQGGV